VKVCLVTHGYPPEFVGGTENAVAGLARGLAREGDEVVVVSGSARHEGGFRVSEEADVDPESGATIPVLRIHRADLYFDHWQKSASARVGRAFRELLKRERPDVVHVHHWIRLSRDLVHQAALTGIPAVVSLHDHWSSCLVTFRVRTDTGELCDAPLAASPCLACAGRVPPRTPWVATEALHMALAERRGDLVRELRLARAVVAPSRSHGARVLSGLGSDEAGIDVVALAGGRDLVERPAPVPESTGPLVLGSWGHLHPLKGTDLLLDALARAGGGIELHLAGGEPDPGFAREMRERVERDGLDVRFHGSFGGADALAGHVVARVHAMVSGTRGAESWGLVVDEAAALRLPMVLPRAGAFPERLEEGRGALFYEPQDAADLARAFVRLRDEPGLAAALRGSLPPLADLVPSTAAQVARFRELYRGAVAAGPPEVAPADWWREALVNKAEEEWDASLARRSGAELGFEEGS